ncbi:MAG: PIN domain-containing protein, partial [Rubrobacteraceae bacterium]
MNSPVLVDTSYWIEYINRPGSERMNKVAALIREDRAATTGIVLAELLQGARTATEMFKIRTSLEAVIWVGTNERLYARAGEIGFALRRKGITIPTTDCIVAAAA